MDVQRGMTTSVVEQRLWDEIQIYTDLDEGVKFKQVEVVDISDRGNNIKIQKTYFRRRKSFCMIEARTYVVE